MTTTTTKIRVGKNSPRLSWMLFLLVPIRCLLTSLQLWNKDTHIFTYIQILPKSIYWTRTLVVLRLTLSFPTVYETLCIYCCHFRYNVAKKLQSSSFFTNQIWFSSSKFSYSYYHFPVSQHRPSFLLIF